MQYLNRNNGPSVKSGNQVMDEKISGILNVDYIPLYEEDNVFSAQELMKWKKLRLLPILNNWQVPLGYISREVIAQLSFSSLSGVPTDIQTDILKSINVKEVMNSQIHFIDISTSIAQAANILLEKECELLFATENNRLVGVVTSDDFLYYFSDYFMDKKSTTHKYQLFC